MNLLVDDTAEVVNNDIPDRLHLFVVRPTVHRRCYPFKDTIVIVSNGNTATVTAVIIRLLFDLELTVADPAIKLTLITNITTLQ